MHISFDDLENPSDLLPSLDPPRGARGAQPLSREVSAEIEAGRMYVETCTKCRGTGLFAGYSTRGRQCFACKGAGRFERRTSPEQRAKAKARTLQKKYQAEADRDAKRAEWRETNKAEAAWLDASCARGFGFAIAMREALTKYGHLTENQMATVRRLAAQDAERAAQRAAERAEREAAAPSITVAKIEESFASAKAAGLENPKLRLADFVFKPAKANSTNAGAIYVTEGELYLGKIAGGKFLRSRDCSEASAAAIVAAASDPASAATAYGQRTGRCSCCGKKLTKGESIDRAIGPVCAEKYGW